MTRRVGIRGIRKSCSMALGDYGITPLEHTGGVAVFVNGGKRAKPFGVLEITNSKGEVVYSHERDEPEATQIIAPRVAHAMAQMMQRVVTDGTAKWASSRFHPRDRQDRTHTGPRDIWFVGGTGKYVTSAFWFGNDDNRPMGGGTTSSGVGGSWVFQQLMAPIHGTTRIPTIPGLRPHPVQEAERNQIAAEPLKRDQVAANGANGPRRQQSIMPNETREALKNFSQMMRKAGGLPSEAPADPVSAPLPPQQQESTPNPCPSAAPTSPPPPPIKRARSVRDNSAKHPAPRCEPTI